MQKIKIVIDGTQVEIDKGCTILTAAQKIGINIPTLCHHPDLTPYGGCRLCVVKIKGKKGMVPACMTVAEDGMDVITEDDEIMEFRRFALTLLLADHPYDCLRCRANMNCELQKLAQEFAVRNLWLAPVKKEIPVDDSSPVFIRDMNRCVRCARCIRTCQEIPGLGAINFVGRGHGVEIEINKSMCESCGECVVRCPTGALAFKREIPASDRKAQVICPYCGTGCGMELHIRRGKVIFASGDRNNPVNRGALCVKGRSGSFDYLSDRCRLTKPLIRKNNILQESSWQEALSLIAEKFKIYRGESFAALSSAKVSNEDNYLMQKFTRVVQYSNNIDHCARLCHASTVAGLALAFGSGAMTNPISDIDKAKLILVTGSNTTENHPVIGHRIRRAVKNGAKLIVVDPRDIQLASMATLWLSQTPGSDVALFNSFMYVILNEGLWDKEFVEKRTEGFEEFQKVIKNYPPERGSSISGVPVEKIVEAARLYATQKPASIIYSMGITQHTTGTDNVKTLANLAMLCGNLGVEGGGVNPLRGQNNVQGACDMGCLPNLFPGYQQVGDPVVREKFARAWGISIESLPEKPGLTVTEIFDAIEKGKVKALYIMGENPLLSDPNIGHVEDSLKNVEFLVVQDIFLTETARFANVVLPSSAYAEREGTYTNTERRVQFSNKAINPPGEAKPDFEIICEIARKLGYEWNYKSTEEIFEEMSKLNPGYAGISYKRLKEEGSIFWPCPSPDHPGTPVLHKEKFTRGKGKFFAVEYIPPAELPDKDFPWILTTGRILEHFHTGTMTRKSQILEALQPQPFIEINPDDARKLEVSDGNMVRVVSRRGKIEIKTRLDNRVAKGVVFIPFHYFEASANRLTNNAIDPVAKIPEFKVCAVRVEKA